MNVGRVARLVLLGAIVALVLSVPAQASAATWDLADEFAAAPASGSAAVVNGVWHFRYGSSAANPGGAALMEDRNSLIWIPNGAAPATPVPWYNTWKAPAQWQSVSVNRASTFVNVNGDPFDWPAGAVLAHPGQAGSAAPYTVIQWKSPQVAGSADVSITLSDLHGKQALGQTGAEFWVYKDSALLGTGLIPEGPAPDVSFTLSDEPVTEDSSIYLVLGPGATYSYDSTKVEFSVEVVDPPVVSTPASSAWSLALLAGMGVAAVPVIRRRRA